MIQDLRLYQAVYEAARKHIDQMPTRPLHAGQYLNRSIPQHNQDGSPRLTLVDGYVTKASALEQIWVRDLKRDWNRFSGASPVAMIQRAVSRGGCYFYQNEAAGMAEMRHYALKDTPPPPGQLVLDLGPEALDISMPHLLAKKAILKVRATHGKTLADFSLYSNAGPMKGFLQQLSQEPPVKQALGTRNLHELLLGNDYAVPRALGHAAAADMHHHGLIAQTARQSDRVFETGDNVCLFGFDGAPVEGLEIVSVFFVFPPSLHPNREVVEVGLTQKLPPTPREYHQLELGL